jgi:hypothetical protein
MSPPAPKDFASAPPSRNHRRGPERDITWDRPVFRPPFLPNPRVIFDPLPFTANRLTSCPRHAAGH